MTMEHHGTVEFILGGIASCGAGIITNPLEVVKTRMQLQGELKARGNYAVHYRNSMHAFYTIAKNDGILALQKGIVPALYYQFFMNGFRLGTYQVLNNLGMIRDRNGRRSVLRSIVAGAFAGCCGAIVGSPFYMVKTHLQAQSTHSIAVGHQHLHDGMVKGFHSIYLKHGMLGLWRGVSAAVSRVMVGSAAQLSTFFTAKDYISKSQVFREDSWLNALVASMISGFVVTIFMTPFDVVSTRLYNQNVDLKGKGHLYSGIFNCFYKINKKEGLWGFYKGWGPSFLRLGPHTILSLVFWDQIREIYTKIQEKQKQELLG